MTRVLVITNNLRQSSFRLRVEQLVGPLRARGFELEVHIRPRGMLARRRLLRGARAYHAVLLQRKMLDPSDARLLRRSARRVLYDVDDAVMRPQGPSNPIEAWRRRRRFDATAQGVDHVVAGNEYLANIFRERGCTATVLPTVVDPARYPVKSHVPTDAPRLVWIGSRSTLPYVREFLPVLRAAAARVPGLRLVTIADDTLSDQEAIPLTVEPMIWSADTESDALCRGDIGIAPTPTDEWTIGKCGFKIVQYMAAGLPVVASPVGANGQIVVPGQTGYLPETPAQWADAIERLARDAALRERLGRAGRARVESRYSLDHAVGVWARLLAE